MPTICEKKRREAWETTLRVAELQINTLRNDCHIFEENLKSQLERYKHWLASHQMEPTVNLAYYEALK